MLNYGCLLNALQHILERYDAQPVGRADCREAELLGTLRPAGSGSRSPSTLGVTPSGTLTTMELLNNLLVGVVSGVAASALFFVLLRRLRPRIGISPFIARSIQGGYTYYDFKIVNLGARSAIDIRVHLVVATPKNVEGGPIYRTQGIELTKDTFFELGRLDERDQNAYYALRFTTVEDIDALWKDDNSHIRLRVMATDAESGFSRAFMHDFRIKRTTIKDGQHEFGRSLVVS